MSDKPVSAQDKFMLRLPDGMREAIAQRAKANGRSMNSEIVQILQDAIDVELDMSAFADIGELNIINPNSDGEVEHINDTDALMKLLNSEVDKFKKSLFKGMYESLREIDEKKGQ